jgi:hypothetical protein
MAERKEHAMSDHVDGNPDATEEESTSPKSSGQEHQNPETEEDTASGGAPDE